MKRMLIVVTLPLLLGGCVLPLQAKLVMWALDGISYLATEKTVTDHGISMVTGRDCSVIRVLGEDPICSDVAYSPVLTVHENATARDTGTATGTQSFLSLEHQGGMTPGFVSTQPIKPKLLDVMAYFPSELGQPEVSERASGLDTQIASISESREPWAMGGFTRN